MEYVEPRVAETAMILCCQCGVPIKANAANMCIDCIRTTVDITEGIQKQVPLYFCRGCDRYLQPPAQWVVAQLESRELLGLCLKRLKGLTKVRLIDANFIWTEPHSKRLKVKLVIQKEVFANAVLQQEFIVEYVVNNQMCDNCHRQNAKDFWNAVVQVRQKVDHKKTFFYLEQLIIKHQAHAKAVNVKEKKDGLDFYFATKADANKMSNFLANVAPVRLKKSEKLISSDVHNATHNYKFTFSVEIAPVCRDDLLVLPPKLAASLGNISQLVVAVQVHSSIQVLDPITLQGEEINSNLFWRYPLRPVGTYKQLIEYTVLDIELVGPSKGKYALADAEVVRSSDFGVNDQIFRTRTHLGNLLKPGDTCLGYDLGFSNINHPDFEKLDPSRLPDVVLVRKAYRNRRKAAARRKWRLASLKKEPAAMSNKDEDRVLEDYEMFMRDLEEDKEFRSTINIYKDPKAEQQAPVPAMAEVESDDDLPEVAAEEMLEMMENLTLEDRPVTAEVTEENTEMTMDMD